MLAIALAAGLPTGTPSHAEEAGEARGAGEFSTPFILSTHQGRTVTDQHFAGYFRLIYFGYTHCPDVCPTTLQTLSEVMDLLGPEADKVQPLFVTVDPSRDTVELLRQYVSSFHPRLVGLTGSPDMIARIARAYRIKYERVEGGGMATYTIDHTASLLFLGPAGEYIGRFPHGMPAADMVQSIREALVAVKRPVGYNRR